MQCMPLKDNKGYYTVEMSILMPIIILCIFIMVFAFVILVDREGVRCEIYSATMLESDEISVNDINKNKLILGQVVYFNNNENEKNGIKARIKADFLGYNIEDRLEVTNDKEELCTERLRRWQLLETITKE